MSRPKRRDGIAQDVHAFDASELLEKLGLTRTPWVKDPAGWVYRGQANANWPLKATAIRKPGAFKECGIAGESSNWKNRADCMLTLLQVFREGLDAAGLAIPTPSPRITPHEQIVTPEFTSEPPREAFPLMALAQHHRLPTMLLDWTTRAFIAAYFAAASAVDPHASDLGSHVAVYALCSSEVEDHSHAMARPNSGHLEIYRAPGGTNPNLQAQAGLFTLLWGANDPSLEEFLHEKRDRARLPPTLIRHTVPRREAPNLLRLLSHYGITGATMFPGADGVVRAMRERALWEQRQGTATKHRESPNGPAIARRLSDLTSRGFMKRTPLARELGIAVSTLDRIVRHRTGNPEILLRLLPSIERLEAEAAKQKKG